MRGLSLELATKPWRMWRGGRIEKRLNSICGSWRGSRVVQDTFRDRKVGRGCNRPTAASSGPSQAAQVAHALQAGRNFGYGAAL